MTIEVPLLAIVLLAVAWIVSLWFAHRLGRRAEARTERLKAKIAVATLVDRITSEVPKHPRVVDLFFGTRDELRTALSKLSCQTGKRRRHRMAKALTLYQTLDIKGRSGTGQYAGSNGEMMDRDRKLMLDGLKVLKDEISAA